MAPLSPASRTPVRREPDERAGLILLMLVILILALFVGLAI